jgi:hypothetical protein
MNRDLDLDGTSRSKDFAEETTMTTYALSVLCVAHLLVASWLPIPGPVMLTDNDDAVVYETYYRGGKIDYLERDASTAQEFKYTVVQPPVPNPPLQNYWESTRRTGNRSFVASSTSPGYESLDVVGTQDATLSVFRPTANEVPSAIVIALRNPQANAGNSGSVQTPITLTIPPRTVAYAALVYRKSTAPIDTLFGNKTYSGSDSAGFVEIARNETTAAINIQVSSSTTVATTTYQATLSSRDSGNITLVTGQFGSEPTAFAAAIVKTPL